jgi:hypothetical protein
MSYDWSTDQRMLAAGNARALAGGDRDAMPISPTAGAVAGSGGVQAIPGQLALPVGPIGAARQKAARRSAITDADLNGNLSANAARLGVDVADLISLRRYRTHRGLRRLSTRKG